MTFISCAQNFEDVMLWRALQHVKNGFYIDVGANDPTIDSVTKSFYDRGWTGINIEPLSSHFNDLVSARPKDINLQCAAGAENGELELWDCSVRGWATASKDAISQHQKKGYSGKFIRVKMQTLTDICELYAKDDIHFLKIDVEGFEKYVLQGIDLSKFRPWIAIVEATTPNSKDEVHLEWEESILSFGYCLAYTDGLNRFYVAKEHSELLESFKYPPNNFDNFINLAHFNLQSRVQQLEPLLNQTEVRAHQAEVRAQHAEATLNYVQVQLNTTLASRSWRVTAPLRWFGTQARRLRDEGLQARLEALLKKAAMHSKLRLGFYNKMRIAAHRLASFMMFNRIFGGKNTPSDLHNMSSLSKIFYENLKHAIDALKKGSR